MYVCVIEICYFVVWSPEQLYIEEVYRDTQFFQEYMEKIDNFVTNVVLSEVIGCWFIRKEQTVNVIDIQSISTSLKEVSNTNSNNLPAPADIFCICKRPDDGNMMTLCDNENCKSGQWFYLKCLNIKCVPKGPGLQKRTLVRKFIFCTC